MESYFRKWRMLQCKADEKEQACLFDSIDEEFMMNNLEDNYFLSTRFLAFLVADMKNTCFQNFVEKKINNYSLIVANDEIYHILLLTD